MSKLESEGIEERSLADTCCELIEIPSVSGDEADIADYVEATLRRGSSQGELIRVGDNIVFKRRGSSGRKLIIAGHLDTVPASRGFEAVHRDGKVYGLGASDMKGGLAVMLGVAALTEVAHDLIMVFYVCEEVDLARNGLRQMLAESREFARADAAILMEPTSNYLEAGCQGTLRLRVDLSGTRAHTARPWVGDNAVSKLAPLISALDGYPLRQPLVETVEYREAISPVRVQGGVANNVVPDSASLWINHRFAPDRTAAQAGEVLQDWLRENPAIGPLDRVTLEDYAEGAPPSLGALLLRELAACSRGVRAKLGWTDVSFFAGLGIPAANFGPGDPLNAHTPGEWVEDQELSEAYRIVKDLVVAS